MIFVLQRIMMRLKQNIINVNNPRCYSFCWMVLNEEDGEKDGSALSFYFLIDNIDKLH